MLIQLALKFGLPWLIAKFPALFAKFPVLVKIIEDLLAALAGGTPKSEAHAIATERIKRECLGICKTDLKA